MMWLARLPGRGRAVVAGGAAAEYLGVIDAGRRLPGGGRMAGLAAAAALDVRGVLAGGLHAVVAAHAVAGDAGVVEARGLPGGRGMAGVAVAVV